MNISERYLKTGGDPRTLPDYAALRDELGKLSHPARPDVNWHYVEKLSLSLFEQNGVELQTAAWYTLARTQLGGLAGLNEGLAILEALISHQWGNLWPQQVHARVEILSGLSRRVQQMMRTLPIGYSDLSQLYRAEQQLTRLNEVLQRLELRHLSQFDALAALMHSSALRLENSEAAAGNSCAAQQNVVLPASARRAADPAVEMTPSAVKWVYIAQPQPEANIEVMTPPPPSRWKPFAAGVVTMLVLGAAGIGGWQLVQRPDPLIDHLAATLSPLAMPLTGEQVDSLKRQNYQPEKIREHTEQQLAWLITLSPDWSFDYGQRLVRQAQAFKPQDAAVGKMAAEWQQQLKATALPEEAMGGWQQGMEHLQQLTSRLNALDGQRGKYITVSELKSVVYNATQAFSRSTPAEEQLRLYSVNPSDIQRRQAEMALEQLEKRYFLLKQQQE
ncbi:MULTISPECIES: VasL domain-containing protein [Erwinia]|uniref:VasL domain-containing protein n=1 Tax=Erwinia TaxID=551 RepID=UPI00105F2896|nr:VasL domain-containing protein [Erwinia aphidicola]MCP2233592.1 type VI secretion system protein VasL [Erwinia aphidicola]